VGCLQDTSDLRWQGEATLGPPHARPEAGSTRLGTLLDAVRVPHLGQGRPRKRPEGLIADKGCDFSTCRGLLRRRGIAHVILRRRVREGHHASRVGRRADFDRETYARRNVVERW
jgi:hypothetical protein